MGIQLDNHVYGPQFRGRILKRFNAHSVCSIAQICICIRSRIRIRIELIMHSLPRPLSERPLISVLAIVETQLSTAGNAAVAQLQQFSTHYSRSLFI